jgi:hypothetical protein
MSYLPSAISLSEEYNPTIYIYIYSAMHSADRFRAMDWLFVIKVQMVDPTVQNNFHMNISM